LYSIYIDFITSLLIKIVREEKATFYDDRDEEGIPKPAGWLFLSAEGRLN
jgi:hypothetical protein